jgi:subtilisin family serine protease
MRLLLSFVFLGLTAVAQIIPGSYVVELSGPPMGMLARQRSVAAEAVNRRSAIHLEQSRIQGLIEKQKGRVLSHLDNVMNGLIVDIPEENAAALKSIPGVKRVFPAAKVYPSLDHALPLHSVPQAWSQIGGMSKAGLGVKIGVLDTGITPGHPAFQDSTLTPPAGYPIFSSTANKAVVNNKIIVARDYSTLYQLKVPDSAVDGSGHGTEVADCAAGVPVKGPFTSITGVAPKAFLGIYKVYPLDGSVGGSTAIFAQAFDDALGDGMDVINLSSGLSVSLFASLQNYVIDQIVQLGVVVVVAGGNTGPFPDTINDPANDASAISVGASQSDREFGGTVVAAGLAPINASSGIPYANPNPPITALLADMSAVDAKNLGCSPLPPNSLTGRIVVTQSNSCLFETVLNNTAAAGGVAVIFYTGTRNAARFQFDPLSATLPAVYVSNADGVALEGSIAAGATMATVTFEGVALPNSPNSLASFSSRGPTEFSGLKPDLSATGTFLYMATETADPKGELYNSTGFIQAQGTSFASPIVAGAAAVLKGARPGLTVDQYRSLLINSATPLVLADGTLERLQHSGSGVLNLAAAVRSSISVFPTSLSFGIGGSTIDGFDFITITNVGTVKETFTITAVPYDYADAPTFSDDGSNVFGTDPGSTTLTVTLGPKQSKVLDMLWVTRPLVPGEYQGVVTITGGTTGSTALMPYWYGVPTGSPNYLSTLSLPTQANVGTRIGVYFKVTDIIGTAILSGLKVTSSVLAGGGSITGPFVSTSYVNYLYLVATLGNNPGTNTFRFQVTPFTAITFSIDGVSPSTPSAAPAVPRSMLPTGIENTFHLVASPTAR